MFLFIWGCLLQDIYLWSFFSTHSSLFLVVNTWHWHFYFIFSLFHHWFFMTINNISIDHLLQANDSHSLHLDHITLFISNLFIWFLIFYFGLESKAFTENQVLLFQDNSMLKINNRLIVYQWFMFNMWRQDA